MPVLPTSSPWWIALDRHGRAVRIWAQQPESWPAETELVAVEPTTQEDQAQWTVLFREFPLHVVERIHVPVLEDSPTGIQLVPVALIGA
jgi:hypothetical protein